MTTAPTSPRFIDTVTTSLQPTEIGAESVVSGQPTVGTATFTEIGQAEIGVWEHTAGTSLDVEVDEAFVVLAGRGSVTFDNGETVELVPGRLVRLHAGERTTWTVHETLRKVYIAG
jgi:uncharacterized cupin superfamily protein